MHVRVPVLALALIATAPAYAEWSGKGEAGLVLSSGNTENETANAKLAMAHEAGNWKNSFGLTTLYASDEDGATAQRWEAFTQADYNFSPRTFWFGAARYEDDRFSGFEHQVTVSSGLGRKFVDSDRTRFVGTAGVGYKFYETADVFDENDVLIQEEARESDVVFRGTLDFEHSLTESTKLLDKFIVESGADNTYYQNDLSMEVRMTAVLALSVGYSVRYNSDPPPGFEKTDTLTTVNMVYEIK